MPSRNRVELMGNITNEPGLRYTSAGVAVANFGLAVDRVRAKEGEVDFFDVKVWREPAKALVKYKKKGDLIFLEGRLEYQTYTDKKGNPRSKHVVVAEDIQYLPSSSAQGGQEGGDGDGRANGQANGHADAQAADPAGMPL